MNGVGGVRRFAEKIGLSPSLVSSYLNGARLPDATSLWKIADATEVSLDWLLYGVGGETPRYRGQSRDAVALEADVAAEVRRAIAARPDQPGQPRYHRWGVHGRAVLADACDRAVEEANRIERWTGKWLSTTTGADTVLRTLMHLRWYVVGPDEQLGSMFLALEALANQLHAQVAADGGPGARYLRPGEQMVDVTLFMPARAALDAIAARIEARLGEEYLHQIAPAADPKSMQAALDRLRTELADTPPNASQALPTP
jgi:transcriptional regulator with XRE-family HTH domain